MELNLFLALGDATIGFSSGWMRGVEIKTPQVLPKILEKMGGTVIPLMAILADSSLIAVGAKHLLTGFTETGGELLTSGTVGIVALGICYMFGRNITQPSL